MHSAVDRNAPCPCGSGRKYKKCHGAPDIPRPLSDVDRANALKAADRDLHEQLAAFARRKYGTTWLRDALEEMELLTPEPGPADLMMVVPWVGAMLASPSGLTIAEEWAESRRGTVSAAILELLDGYFDAWVSLWKITDVKPGVGVTVNDVLTREERFVHEISGSKMMRRLDTVLALIVTCGDVSFFAGLHGMPLPPRESEEVAKAARRMCRVRTRPVSLDMLGDNEVQRHLIAMWRQMTTSLMLRPAPKMTNTDGDELAFIKDDFAVRGSRAAITDRLATFPGVDDAERDGDNTIFVVTRPGNKVHESWDNTIIGRIVLSDTKLIAETTSIPRADSLRKQLESHLGDTVRFRLRSEGNVAQMLAEVQAAPSSAKRPRNEDVPAEVLEMMREVRLKHMRHWVDEPVPALGGMTPRAAAQSRSGKPKLVALLEEFEQHESALPEAEQIDLGVVWEELGLKR